MNLSPLRSHKKHHNFADTPSDICPCNQGIENTRHFLFECLTFATHRARLAVTVTDVLYRNNLIDLANKEELYLYGHPSLILVNNKRILSANNSIHQKYAKILLLIHIFHMYLCARKTLIISCSSRIIYVYFSH